MLTPGQRDEFERRLRDAFVEAGSGRADELLALLGDPPDVRRVPDSFWVTLGANLSASVQPIVVEMAVRSALAMADAKGLTATVNWSLVNGRAARWATKYTFELVKGITRNSQQRLGQLVDRFMRTPGQDLHGLGAEVAKIFGPERGFKIAVTEVTRAASEGEGALLNEIRSSNPDILMNEYWQTSEDEIVCQRICLPLNNVRGDGQGNFINPFDGQTYRLPAHPYCRCARRLEIAGLGDSDDD